MIMINNLQRQLISNFRLAFDSFRDINEVAKNKKTLVVRDLIEKMSNQNFKSFSKWANYTNYAKLTEANLKKMKAINGVI